MKKNRMMRLASILLVATLMSTCTISGTFAKYVTSAESTDTARVAEFGVRITANGETFTDKYQGIETGWTAKNTVDGDGEDVVAPGTAGEMLKMTLTGTPEVAVRVTYEATEFDLDDWTLYDGTTEYCPVVFTINGATYGTNDTAATNKSATVAELETAIKTAIAGYSKEYEPNKDLSADAVKADSLAISWEWPFETGADKTAKDANNVKDTILGDKAAGIAADGASMAKTPAKINIKVATTVTQID